MKKLLLSYCLLLIAYCSFSQNIGIGTNEPMSKLHITGSLVVTAPTVATNTPPTIAQSKTMLNGLNIVFSGSDSTGRIYDPGGPAGNYNANITAYAFINHNSNTGIELTIESINLGSGDSLMIEDYGSGNTLFIVGNNYNTTGKYIFNSGTLQITFKSNPDASIGSGFSLLFRKLYDNSTSLPDISGYSGTSLFFDAKTGAFRAGKLSNGAIGNFSVAFGQGSTASGTNAIAMGTSYVSGANSFAVGQSVAVGNYAVAMGNNSNASGPYSFAMGQGSNASGTNSIAMGNNSNASGGGSIALANGEAAGGSSIAVGGGAYAGGGLSFVQGNFSSAIGNYSFAHGYSVNADGNNSTAFGGSAHAAGDYAIAMGNGVSASGDYSVAMGQNVAASGGNSIAFGQGTVASGPFSTALGHGTTSSGLNTTAMGINASTNGQTNSFCIGGTGSSTVCTSPNQFMTRFDNYTFWISASNYAYLLPASNGWAYTSDRNKKERFEELDGETVLKKLSNIPFCSWNFKAADTRQYRHYGIAAQDFYNAFGKDSYGSIGNDTTVSPLDLLGVAYSAIKALEKRTALQEKENDQLKTDNLALQKRLVLLEAKLDELAVVKEEEQRKTGIAKNK